MIFKSSSGERVKQTIVLAVLCSVLFITFLDTTIVSVTLGNIQLSLHIGVSQLQWVVNGYTLPFASFMLLAGSLADRFGRKKLLLLGLIVFALGALLSALATDANLLIAGRVIMGLGAAASEPGTLSLIRHIYSDHDKRAKAVGTWSSVAGLALASGPILGGLLIALWSWRAIFWFNFIAAVVLVVTALRILPESADRSDDKLDFLGFISGTASLSSLTFAIILGESYGYGNYLVITLFCLSLLLCIVFILAERRSINPMLMIKYLRNSSFSGTLFTGFALFFSIFAIFFFTALYLEEVLNYSGYKIAVDFLPLACFMIVSSLITGRLISKYGSRRCMTLGSLTAAIGIFLSMFALQNPAPASWLVWALALSGIGFGITLVPTVFVALDAIPPERSSMAASSVNTSRELGSVIGVAILGSLVNGNLSSYLSHKLNTLKIPSIFQLLVIHAIETGNIPKNASAEEGVYGPLVNRVITAAYAAFRDGIHYALLLAGIMILISAVVSYAVIRDRSQ